VLQVDIVVPAYNEAASIPTLYERLAKMAAGETRYAFRFLIVDDGSTDDTESVVQALAASDPRIKPVMLSRNFGHQAALSAGLDHADADAVVFLDADLQHPPELVSELLRKWEQGAQVVDTIRLEDKQLSMFKRTTSRGFYKLINLLSEVPIEPGAADFRLLDRSAARALGQVKERARFVRGLVQWIGFRHDRVEYTPEARFAGRSKFSLRKMLRLAFDGLYSFSSVPLRVATWLGAVVSLAAFVYAVYAVYARFFTDETIPGWTSLLVVVLLIGGAQLVTLGILGGYIGRIYEEVRARPVYLLQEPRQNSATAGQSASPVPPLKPTPMHSPPP
jgi:glycosyltransferase involved in cell wall biosynthesis